MMTYFRILQRLNEVSCKIPRHMVGEVHIQIFNGLSQTIKKTTPSTDMGCIELHCLLTSRVTLEKFDNDENNKHTL
jgi:hypothetical protein